MRIGVLATGDTSVRAAHSIAAHPGVDDVVVIGPARSNNFRVVPSAKGCDFLVGSGPDAPGLARRHGTPLIWDGETHDPGVQVWGGSPQGLTLALAADDRDPRLVALAHPDLEQGDERQVRFPEPVGVISTVDKMIGGHLVAVGRCENGFAACYVRSASRTLTILDDARFMKGVALAAGIAIATDGPIPVWEGAFRYLQAATDMGLVMGQG